jgi:pyruvate/2-oxoglutarate dehydrogenase complex dihydrolipoamide acyltransferase (E2) component
MRETPLYDKNGNLFKAHVVNFSWTCDHRIIDGATIARFSNLMKLYLEEPDLMLSVLK